MKRFLWITLSVSVSVLVWTGCGHQGTAESVTDVVPGDTVTPGDTEAGNTALKGDMPLDGESEPGVVEGPSHKVLVAYFSATGVTRGVAQNLARVLSSDIYEIVADPVYSAADLDWNDPNSRASREHEDHSIRPKIANHVENMSQYDVVLIGYPIWWGIAPQIVSTFVESYDFNGKTLAAFATSVSSAFGSSDEAIRELTPTAVWKTGQRLTSGDSDEVLRDWLRGVGVVE